MEREKAKKEEQERRAKELEERRRQQDEERKRAEEEAARTGIPLKSKFVSKEGQGQLMEQLELIALPRCICGVF